MSSRARSGHPWQPEQPGGSGRSGQAERAGRRWTVGQLAHATGLTVRTLHHYDEIGLVTAAERTASGHRRYTEADVRRLYRVRALRGLGLSLGEIATVLDRAADDLTALRDLLAVQLAELEARARQITLLRRRISELLEQLSAAAMPDPEQFMAALEIGSIASAHFTSEQLDFLLRRRHELGEEAMEAMRAEALDLLARIRRHQQDGTPVDDPRVQELTARVDAIGTAFHGGDRPLIAAANEMWMGNSVEISRGLNWPADGPDVVDYLHRARQVRRDSPTAGARPRDGG